MTIRLISPILVLFSLFFSVLCQAQNEVHCDVKIKTSAVDNSKLGVVKYITKGDFMFRKMKNWRILDFTSQDAQLIVDYFLGKNEVLACQSKHIDKTVKVFVERRENIEEFPFKECIAELQEMGYFITRFRKSEEIVVFPMQNCTAAMTIHDFEEDMAIYMECPPCGQVVVKDKQIIEDEGNVLKVNNFNTPEDVEIDSTELDLSIVEEKESIHKKLKAHVKTEKTLVEKTGEIIDHSKIIEGVIDTSLIEQSMMKEEEKMDDKEKSIDRPMIKDNAIILDEEMDLEQVKEGGQKPIDELMLDEEMEEKQENIEEQMPADKPMVKEESILNEEMEAQQENVEEQMPAGKPMVKEETKGVEHQNSMNNDKSMQNELTEPKKMIDEEKQILTQDQLPTFENDVDLDKMKKGKEKDVPKKNNSKE
ncbi:MAG: hypothetical protein R3E32_12660 [Chitinophagales bacterium]